MSITVPMYWKGDKIDCFYRCTVHFDIYKVHTPTNALFIKNDKSFKFYIKITLTCSF